jgi:CHAT domain-containing protein
VNSQAASELTTKTFEQLRRDPALGRAEALRRATLAVMNEPFHSDPAFWGPFSFIGGGGEGRGR